MKLLAGVFGCVFGVYFLAIAIEAIRDRWLESRLKDSFDHAKKNQD